MKQSFTILCIYIFLLSPLTVSSQLFHGGVFGGVIASQIDGDYFAGYHKLGVCGGTYINMRLPGIWGTQMELHYTQKGAASYSEEPSIHKVSLHYVEIPLLFHAYITDNVFSEIGLSAGYLMHTSGRDDGGSLQPLNEYKKQDYNFLLGLNYSFLDYFIIQFRYAYSLTPVREHNTGRYRGFIPDVLNLKDGDYNNLLSLSIYYQLSR